MEYEMEVNNAIDVSIIITTYNHQNYIYEAIQSAVMQAGNFKREIIVSDDGSIDKTPEIVKSFRSKYPDIIIDISSSTNSGISSNMRRCISAARGKFITFIEGDDIWFDPFKVSNQYDFLKENKHCKMCFSGCYFFDEYDGKIRIPQNQNDLPQFVSAKDLVNRNNPVITFSSIMIDSLILKTIPPIFYQINLSEYVLAFYCERFGPIGFINKKSVLYRQHATSVWSSLSTKEKFLVAMEIRGMALNGCSREAGDLLRENIEDIKKEYDELVANEL